MIGKFVMTVVSAIPLADTTVSVELQFLSALNHGDLAVVRRLLEIEPSLANLVDVNKDLSVFELALTGGLTNLAKLLLSTGGFDVNHEGHHPLRISIDLGYIDLATQLLKAGSNPNYRPKEISSALLLCLEKEYYELAELMIEHGAEVDIRNDNGWTPLIWASIKGRKATVEFLLKHGANIQLCNNDGWNAITGAYFKKRTDIVTLLREVGAVFGANYSEAALLSAYEQGYLDIVYALLDQGVSPNVCDDKGVPLLVKTAKNGHHELLKKLVECKADVNCRTEDSIPLVGLLATHGYDELIQLVLKAGADINLSSKGGRTALYLAAENNHVSTVELLISLSANVNAQLIETERTSLMEASFKGYNRVAKALLRAGANVRLKNTGFHSTAMSLAKAEGCKNGGYKSIPYKEIIEMLTNAEA